MNGKILNASILLMIAALACTCCNIPFLSGIENPLDILEDEETPALRQGVLFEDDFSSSASGWEVGDYETGSVGYKGGSYSVVSVGDAHTMWGIANQNFDNLIIEVEASQVEAGPEDNNDYGVACRVQSNGDGYYFLISGDGLYAILEAGETGFEPLVDWEESDAIRLGNATNDIRAICDGNSLTLLVNGQRLATTEDATFTGGDIALTATSYEDVPTEIYFDNLVVRRP